MAQVTTVELVDDMDGSAAAETVSFGLDGTTFEIDLSENHAGVLRDILGDYVERGRKVGKLGTGQRKAIKVIGATVTGPDMRGNREHMKAVREWATHNGYAVSGRGRISREVQTAFDEAHRGSQLSAVG